jgi:hypothetical protein
MTTERLNGEDVKDVNKSSSGVLKLSANIFTEVCLLINHVTTLHSMWRLFKMHFFYGVMALMKRWAPYTGDFVILLRNAVGLLWTSYPPVAKAFTYTGQHNTET